MSESPTDETESEHPPVAAADAGGAAAAPGAGALWVRFAVGFAVLEIVFEILYHAVALESPFFDGLLELLASASGAVLTPFYDSVKVTGTRLSIPGFTVDVDYGCDGIQVCSLLMAAVLAFPAPWRSKAVAIAIGLPWLQAWNVARISSLVAIGKHLGYPIFETSHVYVWPTVLVVVSLASWMAWARWATPDAA